MSLKVARQGYLALGIESTPGTSVPATTSLPFIANTIRGKHEIIKDIASRGSRALNFTSTNGKMWGEGELTVNVDTLTAGFLLKLSTGNEVVNTVQAGVYDHLFYTTVSGNTPLTASIYNYQGLDTQLFPSMTIDKLDLEVKDSLMTAKATLKGFFPTAGAATNATVSGTLLSFNDYVLQLGSSLGVAGAAAVSPVTDLKLSISNNAEVIFESGQPQASRIFWKDLAVTGEFTRFFETTTDRDNYYQQNKQSMILTASGMALPGGYSEQLKIRLAKLAYTDVEIQTGLENFFAVKTQFTAEVDVLQGLMYDITLRNYRSTVYS